MLVGELRAAGFSLSFQAATLYVEPASGLTPVQRSQIRRHKPEILRELHAEATEFRSAVSEAINAARLEDFRASLIRGRLHLCGNCSHFTFGADPAGPGSCALFGDGLVPFALPFNCVEFQVSDTPSAPAYLPDPEGRLALERELAKPVSSVGATAAVLGGRPSSGVVRRA
jgi:hypothetical protein